MSKKTEIHFINGQLITNNPAAFANAFYLPTTSPVDGLTRVSHRLGKKGGAK